MAYFPDPDDVTLPIDTDYVGEATPAELRALKGKIRDINLALLDEIGNATTQTAQEAATALADFAGEVDLALQALQTAMNVHIAAKNDPHEVTKSQVGLGNVADWKATDSLVDGSADKYATAAATKALRDLITAIENWKSAKDISDGNIASRLTALEGNWTAVQAAANAAATSAGTAATQAANASTSASNSANSAIAAQNSASAAAVSAANAASSASTASTKAGQAATAASRSATSASQSNTNAASAASYAGTANSNANYAVSVANSAKSLVGASYTAYYGNLSGRGVNLSLTTMAANFGLTVAELNNRAIKLTVGGFWSNKGRYTSIDILVSLALANVKLGTYPYWAFLSDNENGSEGTAFARKTSTDNLQVYLPSWYITNGNWPCYITVSL